VPDDQSVLGQLLVEALCVRAINVEVQRLHWGKKRREREEGKGSGAHGCDCARGCCAWRELNGKVALQCHVRGSKSRSALRDELFFGFNLVTCKCWG
jgi:hypothetical protein